MIDPFNILVVEDEEDFKRLIEQRFRKEIKNGSYSFFFAGNGREALDLLATNQDIDIVLSDINMPMMDGLTLLSHLRNSRPDLITIIISAYGDMPKIRAAMNLGAFDFVLKPINFTDLKATIQKTLRELEMIRQASKARELESMNEQLREIDRMKTQFLTNVSHEFRTPVTVIDGMADQILAKPDRWLSRGVQMIKRNSARLLDLLDQVLELTKLDDGSIKVSLMKDDVVRHLHQVVEPFYETAERKNIHLHLVDKVTGLKMDYDPGKLKRILSNLLENAIKFNEAGGEVWVEIDRAKDPGLIDPSTPSSDGTDWLLLKVRDTGAGISQDQINFIFDRFYQGDGSSTRAAEGTGLGLALVKELLELMDGRISVSSKEGAGATFQVALPIRQ